MAMNVLNGSINRWLKEIEKAEHLQITTLQNGNSVLLVTEYGDTRALPISNAVAEVLVAFGIGFGS